MAFVAVHLGAGNISDSKRQEYSGLAREACQRAMVPLTEGVDSLTAIVECMTCLEDDHLTNAGVGSNLTIDGTVEMDASVMHGTSGAFGSVAAVSQLRNPVQVATAVLKEGRCEARPDGRVNPLMLCGLGAHSWAEKHGFQLTDPNSMITKHARRLHKHFLGVIRTGGSRDCAGGDCGEFGVGHQQQRLDTVGAVCVDQNGEVCAAASSGGIALKDCGRVGQAALFGCGCWAESGGSDGEDLSVAVTTSGTGEHLIRAVMAKQCAGEIVRTANVADGLRCAMSKFCTCRRLSNVSQPLGGALAIGRDSSCVEVAWAHTTETFFIAYSSERSRKARVALSRNRSLGQFVVEGALVRT